MKRKGTKVLQHKYKVEKECRQKKGKHPSIIFFKKMKKDTKFNYSFKTQSSFE